MLENTPSPEVFHQLAEEALTYLPRRFRQQLNGLAIIVEDFADPATLEHFGMQSPFQLLGLYRGLPLPSRNHLSTPSDQNRVFLYRLPITRYWQNSHHTLAEVVRHVLIHEIGHHFGLSDADMEKIEDSVE